MFTDLHAEGLILARFWVKLQVSTSDRTHFICQDSSEIGSRWGQSLLRGQFSG